MPDALFTVPYPEHAHFVGREEDLERLHAALQGEGPVGINPAAMGNPTGVTGQGGIGKTQLAVAYAYRYREHYPDGVYWLNAAEGLWLAFAGLGRHFLGQGDSQALKARLWETLRTRFKIEEIRDLCFDLGLNYEEFSPQLGISSLARELVARCERHGQLALLEATVRRLRGELAEPQAQDELVAHAFARLRERPQCLLIIDNVANPAALEESLTRDCVPARLPGRVLFTTRQRALGRYRPVELKTLPPDEALKLFLRDPRRFVALEEAHPEHTIAADICAMFGYLPLALEIGAAHLEKRPAASLVAYRDELRRRGALDVMADLRIPVSTLHETGLAAALAAQWETIDPAAQMLLRVAGQFPEANYLPVARLGLLAGVPEEGQSFFDVTLAAALAELQDASLLEELAGDQARLHPLVREFARDWTPLAEKSAFRELCVRQLLASLSDIETLERQVDGRGIDAILRDLLAARELLDWPGHEDVRRDLGAYLRVLRREAHNLRGWRREDAPTFLAQQLQLRLANNATPLLFGNLAAHLRSSDGAWLARWAARSESPALEMTLKGHKAWVYAVAVTPDGRRAVSGGGDGTLRVWDLATGEAGRTMSGHEGGVRAVAVTPDGRRAVSGGTDGTLHVWDLDTGETEWTMTGHADWVRAVAVTPDGRQAVSGGYDGKLRVWNLATGEAERTLTGHAGKVNTVAVTQDGRQVVSGGYDGKLRVWDLATGEPKQTLTSHAGGVMSVAVTPVTGRAVSSGGDGMLRLWNLATGQAEWTLTGHVGKVQAVAVTPDGQRAVSSGEDRTLRVWNLATGEAEQTLTGHMGQVMAIAVTPDGQRAVSSGEDRTLRVWDLVTGEAKRTVTGHAGGVYAVAVTPDGRRAVSSGEDRTLRAWDLVTGEVERTVIGHTGGVNVVAVTPDGKRAIFGGRDGALCVWDLATGEAGRMLTGHGSRVRAVAVTPDGRRAVSGGDDRMLRVWELPTGGTKRPLPGHGGRVNTVAVTSDGRRAVSGGGDKTLRVWNLDRGEVECTLTGHWGSVIIVALTPDGRRVVSGGGDGTLRVWNLGTGEAELVLTGHEGSVRAIAVTPDGQWAVSGGSDRTIRVWNLMMGRELGRLALDTLVNCVAVGPGSSPLVVAGDRAGNVYCLEWVE